MPTLLARCYFTSKRKTLNLAVGLNQSQIRRRFLNWSILSRYKCLRKQFYFPNKLGKSVFTYLETSFSRLRRIEKSQLIAKFEIKHNWIHELIREPLLTLYFWRLPKRANVIYYHIAKWKEVLILKWRERKP